MYDVKILSSTHVAIYKCILIYLLSSNKYICNYDLNISMDYCTVLIKCNGIINELSGLVYLLRFKLTKLAKCSMHLKLGVRDLFSFVHVSFSLYWVSHSTIAAIYSFDGYFDPICFVFSFCTLSFKFKFKFKANFFNSFSVSSFFIFHFTNESMNTSLLWAGIFSY